ncbi:hypothetical protein CDD80_7285 [Ophiocordyceps camponoti-rufipedis]|uniref:Elongator complex protein 2 n=1 Tax=Ophiocordyceps camponoti-rufipedis TaxID=2004952 RepID=A0A2C5YLZ5_9HYPO|nr:hypothetical protein CDD80_7285 [Ophiocordyceps camponoti-rufipedis]
MASVEYLSIGANRHAAIADWSRSGLLAFGADVSVALWRPDLEPPRGIEELLSGHGGAVKAVRFLPELEGDEPRYLLTGSDDGTLIVWRSVCEGEPFRVLQTCEEHTGAIDCITAFRLTGGDARWIVATGAADATIRLWLFADDGLRLRQTIQTAPKYFPLALAMAALGEHGAGCLVLAAAGTRHVVQILTADAEGLEFSLQAALTGHEGWIRSLSLIRETESPGSDVLLASASQDKYVRIWRIHEGLRPRADSRDDALLPSNKAYRLKSAGRDFSVTLDALLLGHEDWIYSVAWHAHDDGKLQLLSASADNSLAVWEADASSGIWVSQTRLGEISMEKGATTATGSTGGFWTGLWSPDGRSVVCLGRTGSWRRWRYDAVDDAWRAQVAISGHTKAVRGISWSKDGGYLLSTSADQTTRLHAQWTEAASGTDSWHEMSRPQIHGYDLNCIDSLAGPSFVSGADEKLMRVLGMPKTVAALLERLSGVRGTDEVDRLPDAANMPVLGLSNKAVEGEEADVEAQPEEQRDDGPPLEETLSRHTLWPELEKLYGHGYEISCLAASHDGSLVASACKASSANHAVIRLFETEHWTEVKPPLTAHSLTTTRLRFSADDCYLLSVGRDRQWAVFEREQGTYRLLQSNSRGHSRMLLDGAWAPCCGTGRRLFATAGRDKQVRLWSMQADSKLEEEGKPGFTQTAALTTDSPVTAIDFLPRRLDGGQAVLALGTESGKLSLCLVSGDGSEIRELSGRTELAFPRAVLQLAWRPRVSDASLLAAAGDDGSLRLFAFDKDCFE